jgi:hypothetical protein
MDDTNDDTTDIPAGTPHSSADDPGFLERVMRYLDDDLPEGELRAFESELVASAEKRRTLALICLSNSLAYEEIAPKGIELADEAFGASDLSMQESIEMPALQDVPEPETEEIFIASSVRSPQANAKRRPWWLAWAAAILVALLGASYFAIFRRPIVATVTTEVTAVWDGKSHPPGSGLSADDSLFLRQGFCKLLFTDGTEVVVEAPSRFTIRSGNSIYLENGSISARMSSGARGFVVTTPTATVTDLGTEFGVKFEPAGKICDVEVFKGKVDVAAGKGNTAAKTELTVDQAAHIADGAVTVDPLGAKPQDFVRNLGESDTSLDVVDLISGGDGTTGRTGVGIEPATGEIGILAPVPNHYGDNQYHRIHSVPVLDGCFIPGSSAIQVDSGGHLGHFDAKEPATFDRIYTGGVVPSVIDRYIPSELGGIDYSAPSHRWLFVHPNAGLTFNLSAIRRLHPTLHLSGLHAIIGNSTVTTTMSPRLMILVDGLVRYDRVFKSHADFDQLNISLGDIDRFLTIAAISDRNGTMGQDTLWGDPVFKMNAKN